jgi:hypothetical protein
VTPPLPPPLNPFSPSSPTPTPTWRCSQQKRLKFFKLSNAQQRLIYVVVIILHILELHLKKKKELSGEKNKNFPTPSSD